MKKMKKAKTFALVCVLAMGLSTQASASNGRMYKQPSGWKYSGLWSSWLDKWNPGSTTPGTPEEPETPDEPETPAEPEVPEETETPETELGTTEITYSKFTHQCPYYGSHPNLRIRWNAVEDAESYEIEIIKGDGTVNTYKATGESFYSEKVDCPRVYNEKTHTWEAASVKVRAKAGDKVGNWSEVKKISCDMLH